MSSLFYADHWATMRDLYAMRQITSGRRYVELPFIGFEVYPVIVISCRCNPFLYFQIWSASNKRWVHVDPCENVIDKPLIYEKGWQKKLTYIIAYSKDEVQDVTWRYTRDQETVMKRRRACTEQSLIHLLQSLTHQRQNFAGYSQARTEYVMKRKLLELADMLYIPSSRNKDSDEETYEGRTSGSLMWRLARSEITQVRM